MEFRVLGPLEAVEEGVALALGGPQQRLVLAYLILDSNHVVATDRLIDRVWGDEPPDGARAALFAYVSRLRKLLGADRIQAKPPGYVLVAERDEIDMLRFTDLVDMARRQRGDPAQAAALLTEALDLWRGSALTDLTEYDAIRPVIALLEEMRLAAIEDRTEAELELGHHRESVPLLERLASEHPLRERLWSLLILALYRSGRQGEALGAFHRARNILLEELGIDPSPELRRLHERVLNQDPGLDLSAQPPTVVPIDVTAEVAPNRVLDAIGGPATGAERARDHRRAAGYLVVGAATALLAVLAALWTGQGRSAIPATAWTIGLEMPLSGPDAIYGLAARNAVQMAIDDLNAAGGLSGSTLALEVLDDADLPERGAANARAFVADPKTIAMIGPLFSNVAFEVIPITNEAGLLECSPASTHPGLTKPRDGALDLRAAHPEAINFVRLAPADDIQASALASFAYRDLLAERALVVDDTGVGHVLADPFEDAFIRLGGTTLRRALNPGADPRTVLAPLDDEADPPDIVLFGGQTDTGAVALRLAMRDGGHLSTPLLSWDALQHPVSGDPDSYLQRVGADVAVGTYVSHASLPDHKFSFADAFRVRFGSEPDEYSAAAYACVEIIFEALRAVVANGPSADNPRESVRAYVVDPAHRYETVLGTVGFDDNGDALQQFVTFYRVERSAGLGAGDWVIFKKQDFGPAP